jgi:hypothetical protein
VQRLGPQKLRTNVERGPGPGDRLTPYDLDVVDELESLDHHADGRNRPDLGPPIRLNQTS